MIKRDSPGTTILPMTNIYVHQQPVAQTQQIPSTQINERFNSQEQVTPSLSSKQPTKQIQLELPKMPEQKCDNREKNPNTQQESIHGINVA